MPRPPCHWTAVATGQSRKSWLIREQMQRSSLTVHAAQELLLTEPPPIELHYPSRSASFNPFKVMQEISKQLDVQHPLHNPNRSRLSGAAKTLSFGAEKRCVMKRTYDLRYSKLRFCATLSQTPDSQVGKGAESGPTSRLGHLTTEAWDSLARLGFPIYLYDIKAIKIRRLE